MVDDATTLLAIGAMAGVTYLTRAGGLLVMGFVTLTPRIEAFLRSLSSSVLVALVVPAALNGGGA
ncbi:MAG TPA: AzlD domain-containing protein, partial [Arenibaculum sp.]|nr:AzlD domain-containing protein [Arenibaculum sp.]